MPTFRVGSAPLLTTDRPRPFAMISESVTVIKGVQTWGTPKGHARREVPIPSLRTARHISATTKARRPHLLPER
jgi:hypothetical protein